MAHFDDAKAAFWAMAQAARSAAPGDVDPAELVAILEPTLDNLRTRDVFLELLARYLGRCLTGSVPDLRNWPS